MTELFGVLTVQLNSIFLLLSFYFIARKISEKISTYSIELTLLFITLILISLISLIFQIILIFDYKFFYTYENYLKKIFITSSYLITLSFLYKKKLNFKIIVNQCKKNSGWINLFIIIFFLCSLGIVSDADSLIYHSKISKVILSGYEVNYFEDNLHFLLIGTYEIFNLLPEIMGISNFNTLLNLFFLINITIYLNKKFSKKIYNKDIFLLLMLSAPIITIIITPQKPFFVPMIVQFMCLMFFLFNKKVTKKDLAICITALILTTLFKLNFIISGIIIFTSYFLKHKKFLFVLKVSFLILLLFIIPQLYFKIHYFGSPFPPFLTQYLGENTNIYLSFAQELKNWKTDSFFVFPFNIFVPSTINQVHNSLGVGLIAFLFIKKYNGKNLNILLFILFSLIISNILFVQQTPRFYFLSYLISLLIILESDLVNKFYLRKIVILQYFFTIIILSLLVPVSISTTFFGKKNEVYKEKFIFRYAVNKKINELIGENNFIVSDLPNYYSKNFEIVTSPLEHVTNEIELEKYKTYLNNNNVQYMLVNNLPLEKIDFWENKNYPVNNFFSKCFEDLISKFSIERANRKKFLLTELEYVDYFFYKKTNNCKF